MKKNEKEKVPIQKIIKLLISTILETEQHKKELTNYRRRYSSSVA